MSDEQKIEKFEKIYKCAKTTLKKIKQLHHETGTYEAPVDMDLVKTVKAMFCEQVFEILSKGE